MSMSVRVNGEEFEGFTDIALVDSMDNLCNQFTLSCTASRSSAFPIPRGTSIEALVNDTVMLTGASEQITGSYDSENFSIKVDGRDNTRNVLKADLPPSLVFKGPISLESVMRKTLDKAGLSFTVTNLAGDLDDFTSKEVLTDDVGSSIWDFWLALAQKRQVLISKDSTGNIIILRPNQNRYTKALVQLILDPERRNNILRASWKFNDSERRHEYNVHSQANMSVPRETEPPSPDGIAEDNFATTEDAASAQQFSATKQSQLKQIDSLIAKTEPNTEQYRVLSEQRADIEDSTFNPVTTSRVNTKGTATDDFIPVGSVSHEVAEHPSDNDECERLAKWNANKARVNAIGYTVTVSELDADGEPWRAGYIIPVIDEIASIDSDMLIKSVEFSSSLSKDGKVSETAKLTMTIPDGFSSDAEASDSQIQTSIIGENWNFGDFQ